MSKSPPTICFVARNDFETKSGGDTVQWQMYQRTAAEAGMRFSTWFQDGPMPPADIYHAFNIDRPLEIYPRMRQVREKGKPFILSSIHHPNSWLEKFRETHPPSGLLGKILYRSPFGDTVSRSESVKEIVRLLAQGRINLLPDLMPSWSQRVAWLLNNADVVMLLSSAEGKFIEKDFGVILSQPRIEIVPNWVEGVGQGVSVDNNRFQFSENPVIVVGRIEARKNVLRLCRLAEKAERPTLFLGRLNPNEAAYGEQFTAAIKEARFARWIPGVPREELSGFYKSASFLLNGSYVEVSPLVDVEALMFGCPVVTTQYALHHDLLPSAIRRCDPYNNTDLLDILKWRPQRGPSVTVIDGEKSKETLLACYHKIISQHSTGISLSN